jgi:hypothetical protein
MQAELRPTIEAIPGPKLSDKKLEELIAQEQTFIEKNPLPLRRYDPEIEKEIENEIEAAYRRLPAGTQISYFKGIEEFRYYLTKKILNK